MIDAAARGHLAFDLVEDELQLSRNALLGHLQNVKASNGAQYEMKGEERQGEYISETLQHFGEAECMCTIFEHLSRQQAVQSAVDVSANLHVLVLEYIAKRLQQPQGRRLALHFTVVAQ